MLKEFAHLNPLKLAGYDSDAIVPEGGLGAVAAYAGLGKTALLVQFALNAMLKGTKVLHVSLNDPVNKVGVWYQELLFNLGGQSGADEAAKALESLLPNRFIMTFKVEGFNVPKFEERLTDLMLQNIFLPRMIILDGLQFDESARDTIAGMKALAAKNAMRIWFTIPLHRDEEKDPGDMPVRIMPVLDLFDLIIRLQPEGGMVRIRTLKERQGIELDRRLLLDPFTMLLKAVP